MLQHDRQLAVIAGNLEKKIKAELRRLLDEEREKYVSFYRGFGLQLKYGVVNEYGRKKDLLSDLLLFHSAAEGGLISLRDYANKMPAEQKMIYNAAAETVERAAKLPQAEQVKEHGFDILCFTDEVDEFVIQVLGSFEEKKFCNVSSDDLGLESEDEKADAEKKEAEHRELLDTIKETLGGRVDAVRISRRLKSHPVCLTSEGDITLEMEKYFKNLPAGRGMPSTHAAFWS
jgi:molecular chaperone HtpG